jgi:soluble lytic murein transglycosylase-like protein
MLSSLTAVLGRIQAIQQELGSLRDCPDVSSGAATPATARNASASPPFAQTLAEARATRQPAAAATTVAGRSAPAKGAYDAIIAQAAARYGVDPDLVHAVVHAESDYDPKCLSHCGATGLMQLMPENVKELGVRDPWDPAQNIDGGVRLLSQLMGRFHQVDLALAAYNAGPGAVRKYGGIPPYRETQGYVKHVLQTLWQRKGQ